MKDYTKTTIRLQKIHKRSLQKSYKGLSPLEKKIIKNDEKFTQLSNELSDFWANTVVYSNVGGRMVADQNKTDWSDFYRIEAQQKKNSAELDRLQTKYRLTEADIEKIRDTFFKLNCCRLYGGSF